MHRTRNLVPLSATFATRFLLMMLCFKIVKLQFLSNLDRLHFTQNSSSTLDSFRIKDDFHYSTYLYFLQRGYLRIRTWGQFCMHLHHMQCNKAQILPSGVARSALPVINILIVLCRSASFCKLCLRTGSIASYPTY